jgi:hypothetical protein
MARCRGNMANSNNSRSTRHGISGEKRQSFSLLRTRLPDIFYGQNGALSPCLVIQRYPMTEDFRASVLMFGAEGHMAVVLCSSDPPRLMPSDVIFYFMLLLWSKWHTCLFICDVNADQQNGNIDLQSFLMTCPALWVWKRTDSTYMYECIYQVI